MKRLMKNHIATHLFLIVAATVSFAACGASDSSTSETILPVAGTEKPRTFCETAISSQKVELGTGDGKSDAIKLYYANQVVSATSLAAIAPPEIKDAAENLRVASVEIFQIFEKSAFDLVKVQADETSIEKIKDLGVQYDLEKSDAAMKKYLLEKCGITGTEQGVPTTIAE
jgi:hypothetical protein